MRVSPVPPRRASLPLPSRLRRAGSRLHRRRILGSLSHTEFNFAVDLCATPENAKCERFYTKSENGLVQTWTGTACGSLKRGKRRSPGRLWSHLFQPERTRNGGTALSRPRARFDICQAAGVSADANILRRSRAQLHLEAVPARLWRIAKTATGPC